VSELCEDGPSEAPDEGIGEARAENLRIQNREIRNLVRMFVASVASAETMAAHQVLFRELLARQDGRGRTSGLSTERIRSMGQVARRRIAEENFRRYAPAIEEVKRSGITSVNGIAVELNRRGIPAPRGGLWRPCSLKNYMPGSGLDVGVGSLDGPDVPDWGDGPQ
jgi:hypothetical protein